MGLLGYLTRPEIRRDPWRLIARRATYEVERRLRPAALDRPRLVRVGHGLRMSLRPSDHVEGAIYLYGLCEFATATVFEGLAGSGMTVLDIGAHVGQYSLLASRAVGSTGRVIAFEPQPDIRRRLEEHLTINGCGNVSVIAKAVADVPGEVWIAGGGPDAHNSGNVGIVGRTTVGAFSVECTTVDQVVDDCGVTRLDLLKIDVEGAEAAVFAGAGRSLGRWHPAIVFEINGIEERAGGSRSSPSIEALRALGYEMFGIAAAPSGRFRLVPVSRTDDPLPLRERWYALNLVALHPDGFITPGSALSRLLGP